MGERLGALALLVEGDLVQETGFRVVEISDQLGEVSFSAEIDDDANPVDAADVFEVGARQIYASFDHAAIDPLTTSAFGCAFA